MTDPATAPALRTGRPTLLTPALADRIVEVVSAGNYLKTAAQFAGVGQSTLMSWLARGRAAAADVEAHAAEPGWQLPAAELPFLEFLERVTQAETRAEVAAVTHWRRAFAEDWRAARDYLGRKRPEQWAAKTTVAISSDEAEARIENAVTEALTALGVDADPLRLDADDDPAGLDEPEEL
jgi:hypothetical protein